MKTRIFDISDYGNASSILKNGDVLAFPTETVYGLGVVYDNFEAFNKLVSIKRRPPTKPFTLMCSTVDEAINYVSDEKAIMVMRKFLPGELTIISKAKKGLPEWVTLGTNYIGIRVPSSDLIRNLFSSVFKPCLVTSANKSGEPTTTEFEDVFAIFAGEIEGIIKGNCSSKTPSTIIKIENNEISLIREGNINFDDIKSFWEELK